MTRQDDDAASAADSAADSGWGPATSFGSASTVAGTTAARPRPYPPATATASPRGPLPENLDPRPRSARRRKTERGLPAWGALLLLVAVAAAGGLVDIVSGSQVRGGFNVGIVVASIVAILAVRRSAMFPVVIAPPLVYSGASGAMLYLRSGGLHDHKVLYDAAANWLVYGFPAIASATAAVLILAGIRMIARK